MSRRSPRAPKVSGEFVIDPAGILRRALDASGLGERSSALLAVALEQAGFVAPPPEPAMLWIFCVDRLIPRVRETAGLRAAESLHMRLAGAITALDSIEARRQRQD